MAVVTVLAALLACILAQPSRALSPYRVWTFQVGAADRLSVLSSVLGPITVDILSSTSLSLSFTDGASITGPEVMLAGEFITGPIATPLPAALPLFATGLGALGLLGWRRKRKQAA